MSNSKKLIIPEVFIKFFKSIPLAAVFKQLIFWSDKGSDFDGWVYKTAKELATECCISTDQVDRAMVKLSNMNLIEFTVKKVNSAPTRYYKVNYAIFINLALQPAESLGKSYPQGNSESYPQGNSDSNLGNGSEIPKTPLQPAESLVSANRGMVSANRGMETANRGNHLLSDSNYILKDKKTIVEATPQPLPDNTNVDFIFQYWRNRMRKNNRTRLTDQRKKLIKARLVNYSVAELKQAIDGCAQNPFNMGGNDDGKVYDDITLIFRNDTKLEQYRDQFNQQQSGSKLNGTHQHDSRPSNVIDINDTNW